MSSLFSSKSLTSLSGCGRIQLQVRLIEQILSNHGGDKVSEKEKAIAEQLSAYVNKMDEHQLFALTCRAGGMVDQKEIDENRKKEE